MYLETEDVKLYYEQRGQGKPLLLIHGVVVDAGLYEHAARLLAPFYQVVTYDRRGNSRSGKASAEDYSIPAQVRDVKALMDHLGLEQVFLAGASGGSIVSLEAMKAMPERICHVLVYEPPLISLLDGEEEQKWVAKMEETVSRRKINTAMLEFMRSLGETDERREEKSQEESFREMENFQHFLGHEFSVIMHYSPDLAYFQRVSDNITVAIGERSGETKYVCAARRFRELVGCELLHFPGCHNLPGDLPLDFVNCLMGILARKGWR